MSEWMPITSEFDLERVIVCGFQDSTGYTQSYWWYHEDVIIDGKASDTKGATHCVRLSDIIPSFDKLPKGPQK